MKLHLFLAIAIFIGSPTLSYAESKPDVAPPSDVLRHMPREECGAKTMANINVQLMKTADSFKALSDYVDQTREEILSKAKRMGISDIELKNSNFSINSTNGYNRYQQNDNASYNVNGNLYYETSMTEKAIAFAEALSGEDYKITYNENMRRGYCPHR